MKRSSRSSSFRSFIDSAFFVACRGCLVAAAILVACVLVFLVRESWPTWQRIPWHRFFTDSGWHPVAGEYWLIPMIVGTALSSGLALVIAGPLGLGTAVFSRLHASRGGAWIVDRSTELLAGLPSVVFGLWGLVVLAPWFAGSGSGQGLLTASIVLSLMILPTIALTASAALRSVPAELLQGAAALGLSRVSIMTRVALPAAWPSIRVGLLLALTRALGETMAVVMVAGNVASIPTSLQAPIRTMTATIALELGYASADHRSMLFAIGTVMMVLVLGMVWLSGPRRADS